MSSDNVAFQKVGDICDNCKERWVKAGKSPIALVALPSYTMRYHSPVAICPWCDSSVIGKLAVANAKKRNEAPSAT
jgi:hypothetical protein